MQVLSSTPKAIAAYDSNPLRSLKEAGPSTQEKTRTNILAKQAENSIINLGHPTNFNHNPGVIGNKSMTEYLYKKQNNLGGPHTLKQSYANPL